MRRDRETYTFPATACAVYPFVYPTKANTLLCKRGGFMESLVPELIAMPDEDAKAFLRLALTSEPAQEFLKKRAGDGNAE